ncbi:MAG: A/G-specific adenine glycosylase [Bacteroidales bacterium]
MKDSGQKIADWYQRNARDLPWRQTRDPYKIWLSEVILQQTRVSTGLAYYQRIVKAYPDVQSLAAADDDAFMLQWQGLGYYRRAENLLSAARYVTKHLDGKLPGNAQGLRSLRGIGHYTAAAIASFAYDEPVQVMDGNVRRVISRLFDLSVPVDTSEFEKTACSALDEIFDRKKPALFNQAIMEFGALLCKKVPLCRQCPVQMHCLSFQQGIQQQRPVKGKATKKRSRYICYFVWQSEGKLALVKRGDADIWRSLYEFPNVEMDRAGTDEQVLAKAMEKYSFRNAGILFVSDCKAHVLSHQSIKARIYLLEGEIPAGINMVSLSALPDYPMHRLMEKIIDHPEVQKLLS